MFLVLPLLAGVPVNAQKSYDTKPTTTSDAQYVNIQDDKGAGYLVINLANGAYKAKLCSYGYSFSGTGSVKVDGCSISFSAVQDSHTITAFANLCDRQGSSFIQVKASGAGSGSDPLMVSLSDSNISDGVTDCAAPQPPPPAPVPSEIIIQNDADGSFLQLSTSGEYKFIHCEDGVVISGLGRVTIDGDLLYFEHITSNYRVVASVNLVGKDGKAAIEVFTAFKTATGGFVPVMQEYITDTNLTDNTTACGAKK
jgi:hypothetical protein